MVLSYDSGPAVHQELVSSAVLMSISCAAKTAFPKTFSEYLANYRFTDVPSPLEAVPTDDATEFKDGVFSDHHRERGIRQAFTNADSPQLMA